MHLMQLYERSPLHVAAWFGDLVCVKWLVEHGALLNTSDTVSRFSSFFLLSLLFLQFGERPLMAACASLIDAPLKVRYLAEAGADYLAQGPVSFRVAFSMQRGASWLCFLFFLPQNGVMALSCAVSLNSKQSESVQKDLVQYLIVEKGLDVNHRNNVRSLLMIAFVSSIFPF